MNLLTWIRLGQRLAAASPSKYRQVVAAIGELVTGLETVASADAVLIGGKVDHVPQGEN